MNKIGKNHQSPDARKKDDKVKSAKSLSSTTPSLNSDKDPTVQSLRKKLTSTQNELQQTVMDLGHAKDMLQKLKEEYSVVDEELRTANDNLTASNKMLEQEISMRVWAEDSVQKERKRFYDVLETLPAYVILLTPDYHVPFANRFFRERFGESFGKRCYEYLFGLTEPCEICDTYTVLKTKKPHRWEWLGPDGRNYDIYDYPFTDPDGSPMILEMGIDITELKQSQKMMLEANETLENRVTQRTAELENARSEAIRMKNSLEAVMSALPIAMAIVDEKGGNIKSNQMFEILWGTNRPISKNYNDYAAYRAWWVDTGKLVQPEEWGAARAILKGETVIGQMMEIESFDGNRKFIMSSAAPIYDADGKIVGSAVTTQDITQIKHAEKALRESETRYRNMFTTMSEGFVLHEAIRDMDGNPCDYKFLEINPAFERITGISGKDVVGKTFREILPDASPAEIQRYGRVLLTGEPDHFESFFRPLNHWYEAYAYQTGPELFATIFMDITSRKENEETIRRAKVEWEKTFDSVPDLIAILDDQRRVVRVNRAMADRLGLTPAQCVGLTCYQAFHGTDTPPLFCPHSNAIMDGQDHIMEVHEERLGGDFLITDTPIMDENGKMVGSVHVARDITELKQKEEHIRSMALFPEENPNPVLRASVNGILMYANRAAESLLKQWDCRIGDPLPETLQKEMRIAHQSNLNLKTEIQCDGRDLSLTLAPIIEGDYVNLYGLDITQIKRAVKERETAIEFLQIVHTSKSLKDLIYAVITYFQQKSGCSAVGIRLRQGDDYPYYETQGLPDGFILLENSLCARDSNGDIIKDSNGNPVLECMCDNVIHGRFDPSKPFFTTHGSFWTNSTTQLLASFTEADRQARTRNRCNGEGYESVALIPLLVGEECLGLLQINDTRKGVFSLAMIHLWERMADYLAVALAKLKIEESLTESRQDLKRAQAMGAIGSWRLNIYRNELSWSDENYRIFGISQGTPLTYETFLSTIHPDDRDFVDRKWNAGLRGEPYDIEHRIIVNENVKWVRERAELEFDKTGELIGGFGTTQDITQRRKQDDALRQSESRFKLLSEIAELLLISQNPEAIVNSICHKVTEYLDCQACFNFLVDDAAGKLKLNTCIGIADEEVEKIRWLDFGVAVCGCAARDGVPIIAENIPTTPDPRTGLVKSFGIQAYACHPMIIQGKSIGTLSFGTKTRTTFSENDLTIMRTVTHQISTAIERTRLIAELQKSREELEIRVEERTAQVQKTNVALQLSNKALEEFAYVASHDLQEPLRKIQTFADRLKSMPDLSDDRARDYLARMYKSSGRMRILIQDLLSYSRLAASPEPFTLFNLKEPIDEALKDLQVLIEETQAKINIGELPDLTADKRQMRHLFLNLIGNALKYRSDQKPDIRINVDLPASDQFFEIHVKDNGIGFEEIYLDKIFLPFQRLHGKNVEYPGTGIGLAICRRIVENNGGSITATSQPGKGSTFIVKLPRKRTGDHS